MSETQPNIHQRILAVIADTGAVPKDGKYDAGQTHFQFHKIDDVVEHLRPALVKRGVLMLPTVLKHEREVYDHVGYYNNKETHKRALHSDAIVSCTFVNVDKPEDRFTCESFGDGIDFADKSAGKAISYALKNLLLALFQLRGQPDNEDSGTSSDTGKPKQQPAKPKVPKWDGKDWKTAIFHAHVNGYEKLLGKTLAFIFKADRKFIDWAATDLKPTGKPTAQDASLRKALDAYVSARDAQQAPPAGPDVGDGQNMSGHSDEPPFE